MRVLMASQVGRSVGLCVPVCDSVTRLLLLPCSLCLCVRLSGGAAGRTDRRHPPPPPPYSSCSLGRAACLLGGSGGWRRLRLLHGRTKTQAKPREEIGEKERASDTKEEGGRGEWKKSLEASGGGNIGEEGREFQSHCCCSKEATSHTGKERGVGRGATKARL